MPLTKIFKKLFNLNKPLLLILAHKIGRLRKLYFKNFDSLKYKFDENYDFINLFIKLSFKVIKIKQPQNFT